MNICKICNQKFVPKRKEQKICSVTCRQKNNANSKYGEWRGESQQPASISWQAWHQFGRRGDANVGNFKSTRFTTCEMGQRQMQYWRTSIEDARWWGAEPNVGIVVDELAFILDGIK